MQTNPQIRTNVTKVVDCVEYGLTQMLASNEYLTDGVAVERKLDPRRWAQNLGDAFREKGTIARVRAGDRGRIPGQVGDSRRWTQEVTLTCCSLLARDQDEKGVTLDQILEWLAHDVEMMCARDIDCQHAAANMNMIAGPWGAAGTFGGPPHCQNLRLEKAERNHEIVTFPYGWQVMVLQFEYDSHGPNNFSGTL